MSGHKLVSISSLLSPRVDDININSSNDHNNETSYNMNKTNSNLPFPILNNPITANNNLINKKEKNEEIKRKTKGPMSVSNLMNSPIPEINFPSIPSTNDDVPSIEESITNTKKKNTKKKTMDNRQEKSKKKEENEISNTKVIESNEPIIVTIDIPLSTHNDIHTEHNFAKLVEEKYGCNYNQSSLAKGLWNFDADDAEGDEDEEEEEEDADLDGEMTSLPKTIQNEGADGDEEEEEEEEEDDEEEQKHQQEEDDIVKALKIKFTPGMSDMEKESLVLKEIHRRKMVNNKRIGKYDIDDPFIDDEELEFEEETGANADGWFIWHGKLDVNKKKKAPFSDNKVEKVGKQNKTNNTYTSTSRSKYSNNTTTSSISSGTTVSDKHRKTQGSELQPHPKKVKKVSTTTSIDNQNKSTNSKNNNSNASMNKTKTLNIKDKQEGKEQKENKEIKIDAPNSNNKIIIGSFGFGTS